MQNRRTAIFSGLSFAARHSQPCRVRHDDDHLALSVCVRSLGSGKHKIVVKRTNNQP